MNPPSWKCSFIGQHAVLLNGFAFPSEAFTDYGGMPLIRIRDLCNQSTTINFGGHFDPKYIIRRGDILIGMDGDFDTVKWKGEPSLLNQRVCKVESKDSRTLDPQFLFYRLIDEVVRINRVTAATTVKHLSSQDVLRISIELPPPAEQSKIAEVLSTVDRAIEQTEALIAKQQRIKTGLMQDLLTRGIDEQGNLRSEQTHEFKDSPLGRIPVEWDVEDIQSLLADVDPPMRSGPFGSSLLKEELVDSGIPLLGIDNVFPERFVRDYKQLQRYRVWPGDLMITIMGTVGRCCVVPDDVGEALSSKHVWTISLDKSRYSPYVACLQINHSPWVLNHFAKDEQGGIMASIRSETLRSTQLPVPPPDEMGQIEACLRSICDDLDEKERLLQKLSAVKTGLMQDLLTGNRRVTPLLELGEGATA
jgi:type I restriction enzyme S subunit